MLEVNIDGKYNKEYISFVLGDSKIIMFSNTSDLLLLWDIWDDDSEDGGWEGSFEVFEGPIMVQSCDQKSCCEASETAQYAIVINCATAVASKHRSSVGLDPFDVQFPHCLATKICCAKFKHHDGATHQPTGLAGVWLRSKATKVDKVAFRMLLGHHVTCPFVVWSCQTVEQV